MIIVQIIHSLNPGGAERLVVDLANEYSQDRLNKVYLICLKNRDSKNETFYKKELSKKVEFIPMGYGDGFRFSYLTKLYQQIKKIRPEIVHIHCQIHYLFLAFALYHKCRYVYTLHNRADVLLSGIRKYVASSLSSLRILKVASISGDNQKSLRQYTGIKSDALIYNGRSKPLISSLFNDTKTSLEKLKTHPEDVILLSIAKCSSQKNLSLLIESVQNLKKRGEHILLVVLGDGYFDTSLGKQLRDLAGSSAHFLGPKSNVCDYFNIADAFCLSSSYEGMPITLIESYACGCIPISTPVSGSIDIIEDGKTGYLSPNFTLEGYISTIERFLKYRSEISKSSLVELYEKSFSIQNCAREYRSLYQEILTA